MQQADDPPSLPVGTEVSAKYKGAFCEAKVSKVVRNIKVKVAYKQGLGSGIVSDDAIKAPTGQLRVGAIVEVRHPDRKETVEATITKIQDCSQYTVVFDDGDITTLRRTALCLKSGRHFNESETLDQLPLTHPEHFGNPVVGGRRGRRRGQLNGDSSDDDDESDAKEVVNEKEENIGKVVCVETESKKKDKEKWFPALVVAPTAQATVRIRVKDEYLVRSFKDGRYYTVPKKEATEFTREVAGKQDVPAVQAALEFLDSSILPPHWDRDSLFGLSNLSSDDDGEIDSDSSDDEPHEEKDRFVAQLYKYMDDRGTPLNKVPSIQSRDVDLYRLFRAVQKRGGYNRVTTQNQWKVIAIRLGFAPCTISVMNLVKQAYKKFLQPYGDFHRKLGCSMLMTSRNSNRSKGRSLVRANSVASPKPAETKTETLSKLAIPNMPSSSSSVTATAVPSATQSSAVATSSVAVVATAAPAAAAASHSAAEESENTSESSVVEPIKKQRKASAASSGKVKSLVEKYEEKSTTAQPILPAVSVTAEADIPLAKIKAAAATRSSVEKEPPNISSNTSTKALSETQRSRDASPSAAPPSNKKEKHQRKQIDKTEEKRGKRKKEDVTVEKIDTGDFEVGIGDKLKVNYHEKKSPSSHGSTYEAKVIEISVHRGVPMYLVHYTGWNNRYDEWVPRERIAENITKGSKQKTRSTSTSSANSGIGAQTLNSGNAAVPTAAITSASSSSTSSSSGSPGDKQVKDAPSVAGKLTTGSAGTSAASQQFGLGSASGNAGNSANAVSVLQTVVKTPTTTVKRGRGRSDSMPPRSTTPSSVASNSSRTKSPAASQLKKRPTRTALSSTVRRTSANASDISMATESDTDSDEPVRRPKRQNTKDQTPFKGESGTSSGATKTEAKSRFQSVVTSRNSPSDSDEDDDEHPTRVQQQEPPNQRLRTGATGSGMRALSSGASSAAGSKGRDYDLSEIRSELKGFQSQHMGNVAADERKESNTNAPGVIKMEYDGKPSTSDVTKRESKYLSNIKSESGKSSSTELSSGTDSCNDEDSQSSDKAEYKKQQSLDKKNKRERLLRPSEKLKPHPQLTAKPIAEKLVNDTEKTPIKSIKTSVKEESNASMKTDPEYSRNIIIAASISEDRKTCKVEVKEDPDLTKAKQFQFADIKPTTVIAPARFGSAASTSGSGTMSAIISNYTSVIVEKPLGTAKQGSKLENVPLGKKLDMYVKKPGPSATAAVNTQLDTSKKFIEPVLHKETATLKVELPAACSPSSSSSSSSSCCSTASAGTTLSISNSSTSSAARSLPDMSKLDISCSAGPGNVTAGTGTVSAHKEPKYSGSSSSVPVTGKMLSSDVYEFKDNEPFEFEKRISPMAAGSAVASTLSCSTSVITATTAAVGVAVTGATVVPVASVSAAARKQALKASAMQQSIEQHQLPHSTNERSGYHAHSVTASASTKLKKRGSPMKEAVDKPKVFKSEEKQSQPNSSQSLSTQNATATAPTTKHATLPSAAGANSAGSTTALGTQAKVVTAATVASSDIVAIGHLTPGQGNTGGAWSKPGTEASPHAGNIPLITNYATPFDVLRKSPSFNLNITALNEELAQTVQETTRALTDALQPSTTPVAVVPVAVVSTPIKGPKTKADAQPAAANKLPSSQAAAVPVSTKLSTPPHANTASSSAATAKANIVGSPFIETRNVFELSTSNEGSGYSSGESKDNKLEKLENVKILLAGTAGSFDLDAVKYEQKPSSIADKVLKAISQKKEEVENSKTKVVDTVNKSEDEIKPEVDSSFKIETLAASSSKTSLNEPLKIQTGSMSSVGPLGELYLAGSNAPGSSGSININSPESKSILESLNAKNNELSETILKLECAIQRKTPVSGLSLGSSTAGTPPTHTPNSTATAGAGYSDESMSSTDSEQRLVIEDVMTEEQTTTGEQKSPLSEASGSLSAPVKLESNSKLLATVVGTPGLQAPIPLKLGAPGGAAAALNRTQSVLTAGSVATSFAGKLPTAFLLQPPPLSKLQTEEVPDQKVQPSTTTPLATGVAVVVPEIPVSVVVASNAVPVLMTAALSQSPNSMSNSASNPSSIMEQNSPVSAGAAVTALTSAKLELSPNQDSKVLIPDANNLLLKTYTKPQFGNTPLAISQSKSTVTTTSTTITTTISEGTGTAVMSAGYVMEPAVVSAHVLSTEDNIKSSTISTTTATPAIQSATAAPRYQLHGKESTLFTATGVTVSAITLSETTAQAAASLLACESVAAHNESINLLCEETIPGSPAPIYSNKDEQPAATPVAGLQAATTISAPVSALVMAGITPLPPDTPPPTGTTQALGATGLAQTVTVSAPNSSPNDSASQDDSSEETINNSAKKHAEHEISGSKRKRTRKQTEQSSQATESQPSLGKRRRHATPSLRKTTTTAGSDTDDNSDNIVTTQRQSTRQQLLPQQAQSQQQQQQQQQQIQLQQQAISNTSGVRPCPYNFLVELDPSLSSDQCITILRKQIQDLRKAYNTIKSELAVIDRRRKKMRRREREKKQQQMQSQQQGKVCA